MSLDLYSKIEPYLDFGEEIYNLHNAFLEQIITKDRTKVLDFGCGQGDFLYNLDINEIENLGIDLSSEQVAVCKKKGLHAQCIDICELDDSFDCITAIFDVINYIPLNDLEKIFACTNARLEEGGYFIFDVNTLFGFEEIAQGTLSIDLEDKFINIDAIFEDNCLETKITLFTKNSDVYKKEQSSITQHYHSIEDLKNLLQKNKFIIEEINDFYLHNDEQPDKQIWICKK